MDLQSRWGRLDSRGRCGETVGESPSRNAWSGAGKWGSSQSGEDAHARHAGGGWSRWSPRCCSGSAQTQCPPRPGSGPHPPPGPDRWPQRPWWGSHPVKWKESREDGNRKCSRLTLSVSFTEHKLAISHSSFFTLLHAKILIQMAYRRWVDKTSYLTNVKCSGEPNKHGCFNTIMNGTDLFLPCHSGSIFSN